MSEKLTLRLGDEGAERVIRVFKHYVPYAVLLLGAIDFVLLMLGGRGRLDAAVLAGRRRVRPGRARGCPTCSTFAVDPAGARWSRSASTASQALQSVRFAVARLLVAVALGIMLLSLVFFLFPPVTFWRSSLLYATWLSLARSGRRSAALLRDAARRRALQAPRAGARRRRRAAPRIEALAAAAGAGFAVVGFVGMNDGPPAVGACGQPRRHRQPARPSAAARRGRGRARARGAAQRAAAERSAADQDHRRRRSTISPPSSSARPAASISTASTRPG